MEVPMIIRKALLGKICQALGSRHYVVCICPARSGLSTVLQQLRNYIVQELQDFKYILIGVSKLNTASRQQFCTSLGQLICSSEPCFANYLNIGNTAYDCLAELALKVPSSTVIAIDNFDKLPITSQREFLEIGRRFYTESHCNEPSYQKTLLLIGGAIDLFSCEPEETSPFNIAEKIYAVDFDLSKDEVGEYLTQWLSLANLYTSKMAQNHLYDITRGQVYFLERVCKRLVSELPSKGQAEVSIDELDSNAVALLDDRDEYLDELLKRIQKLEPEAKVLLSEVLGGSLHKFSLVDHSIRQLELLGVIRASHPFVTIRNPLLERFVRESVGRSLSPPAAPTNLLMPKVVGVNLRAYKILFELENEIRNFIVSRLYSKYKTKWADHLPQSEGWKQAKGRHAQHRKVAWEGRGSYPLMAYSQFNDLRAAVEENWGIFEDQFHPKEKFAGYFGRLEEIRHTVAHNRRLSHQKLRDLESIREAFKSCMAVG